MPTLTLPGIVKRNREVPASLSEEEYFSPVNADVPRRDFVSSRAAEKLAHWQYRRNYIFQKFPTLFLPISLPDCTVPKLYQFFNLISQTVPYNFFSEYAPLRFALYTHGVKRTVFLIHIYIYYTSISWFSFSKTS